MNNTNEKLIQITGSRLCAGMVVRGGVVVETAPILKHYRGLTEARALELCKQKGMRWKIVEQLEEENHAES